MLGVDNVNPSGYSKWDGVCDGVVHVTTDADTLGNLTDDLFFVGSHRTCQ